MLGFVSLLNDAASEMVTPLLPIFLTATLGAGPAIVGLIEGAAESAASVLKLVSGWLTDRGWNAKGLVVGGYALSNGLRPLIGVAAAWSWVLALRFLDRVGKGLRTAPRDAMIAAVTAPEIRGRAFGFHRSMDHLGAVVGPLLAFALLSAGLSVRQVFLSSLVIGVVVIATLVFGVPKESSRPHSTPRPLFEWRTLDGRLRRLLLACGALAIATTPEAFLVLWAKDHGLVVTVVPLLWAVASVLKMSVALPAGILSDRLGRLPVLIGGWALRVLTLAALAWVHVDSKWLVWMLFLAYAATLAMTESAERSLVGDIAAPAQRGTAFGWYHLMSGLLLLPGALIFGSLWEWAGSSLAFGVAAGVTLVAAVMMLMSVRGAKA
ncbi:MAG TPA: MFS transporter [Steroidobacteraceae bacterium]|nr:MFS transporter [Steroidobacteraceae bacterium]